MSNNFLSINNLSKIYSDKNHNKIVALENINLTFSSKGMVFILGKSGSGKSTLLNTIGGLDRPDNGSLLINGNSINDFNDEKLDSYRNSFIGFVFQEYNLLDEYDIKTNLSLALELQGKHASNEEIQNALEQVELKDVIDRKPNTLSGGQKQRVAIARALIKKPSILMADEPTGALDSESGKQVFEILKKLSAERLVIVVSHDADFAKCYGDRIIELKDGKVVSDKIISSKHTENAANENKYEFKKSKLPYKRILNIGLSNIKSKPIKTTLTSILSIFAFAFLGIFSTLALYDPSYTYTHSFKQKSNENLLLSKQYNYKETEIRIDNSGNRIVSLEDDSVRSSSTSISKKNIELLNNNDLGIKFAGIYRNNFGYQFYNFDNSIKYPDYYEKCQLFGICDCGHDFLISQGFEKIAGNYPKECNQIAVSTYVFDFFKEYGYINPLDSNETKEINKPEDLINCVLNVSLSSRNMFSKTIPLKISGVYKVDETFKDSKFDILKQNDHSNFSPTEYKDLLDEFNDLYRTSFFGLGYVADAFYSNYKDYLIASYDEIQPEYHLTDFYGINFATDSEARLLDSFSDKNSVRNQFPIEDYCTQHYLAEDVANAANDIVVTDINGNKLDILSKLDDKSAYLNADNDLIDEMCNELYGTIVDAKYVVFNRSGEMNLIGLDTGKKVPLFINYDNLTLSFKNDGNLDNVESVLLDDEGNVKYYLRTVYFNDDRSDFAYTNNSVFTNEDQVWFRYDGSTVNNIEYRNLKSFYYDMANNHFYFDDEVEYNSDSQNFYVSANPSILVEYFPYYSLDESGNLQNRFNQKNLKSGLFVNVNTGELSFSKKDNFIFTDSYFVIDGEIFVGTLTSFGYAFGNNENITYTFTENGTPLGYTSNYEYLNNLKVGYLNDKEDILKSVVKYWERYHKSANRNDLSYDNHVLDQCSYNFNEIDLKNILEGYKKMCEEKEEESLLAPTFGLLTSELDVLFMNLEGFYIESSDLRKYSEENSLILGNNWKFINKKPSYIEIEDYRWEYEKNTKFSVNKNAEYSFAIGKINKTEKEFDFLLKKYDDDSFFKIENKFYSDTNTFAAQISDLKVLFLIFGCALAVFSGLMLFVFISSSLNSKKRDIGILRALGARKIDIIKIFLCESIIVSIFSFIFSSIIGGIASYFINESITNGTGIKILNFNMAIVLMILSISLLVGLFTTIFPILKVSKKPPVEVIKSL